MCIETIDEMLVVEDETIHQFFLKKMLKSVNICVNELIIVERLADIKSVAEKKHPNVILLDLNLPDSNGLETVAYVNSFFSDIPIIVLSSMSESEVALQSIGSGAQDYLVKGDFDEKVFLKVLKYSMERKKNQLKLSESNERYEIVSKATNDPVWDLNLETNEILWNNKVDVFGYPASTVKNNAWFTSCLHPEDSSRVSSSRQRTIFSNIDQWSETYRFLCANGEYKYILDRGFIMRTKEGKAHRMIGSMLDITERKQTEEKLENYCTEIRKLTEYLINVREEERTNMAREIHDEIGQQLTAIKMDAAWIIKKIKNNDDDNRLKEKCTELLELIDECVKTVRKIASDLRPPILDDMGLVAALDWYCHEFEKRFGIDVIFNSDTEELHLPENYKINLFRICQESLTNVARHSCATQVNIFIKAEKEKIILTISDNGRGFDTNIVRTKHSFGILGMQDRAKIINGTYKIESMQNIGTIVQVSTAGNFLN